jgi:integrase
MARKATGQVVERKRKRGRVFGLRFRAGGQRRQYVTLPDGTTREEADRELRHVLADVERGTWRPPEPAPEVELPKSEPTFHEFASEWWEGKRRELRPGTVTAYEWHLTHHLLPYFARHRLSQITVEEVDRYRASKVREREARSRLSDESINKTLTRLAQILEVAVEYGHLDRNPAAGKRRRLKVSRPRRAYLDRAVQMTALLDAAGRLDREARADRRGGRRALLATLMFAGLRISEALSLRWRDVDLAAGRLYVGEAKTDAGVRQVPILPVLRDELAAHKAEARFTDPDDLVFCTRYGNPLSKDNTRERVLGKAIEEADEALVEAGHTPLPERLTQHSLRHTYISVRMALGHDLASVSEDAGHSDMSVTYRIYTHVMRLDDDERERLRALVEGSQWAPLGTSAHEEEERESAELPNSAL